jgi:hypothetical protein
MPATIYVTRQIPEVALGPVANDRPRKRTTLP